MIEVLSLLVMLVMSLCITRVATVALTLTGMSQQAARFQARSALTGAGFTTSESERVVNHPVRRRVIMWLMLIGNGGLVLAASLMILFLGGERSLATRWEQVALLLGGLIALLFIARSRWLERAMARGIERLLGRYTDLPSRDHASLLRLGKDYRVVEMAVEGRDWLAGRTLAELELSREGVLVLGVKRADGDYVGTPRGDTEIAEGDVLTIYGRGDVLGDIDRRRAGVGGQLRHIERVAEQKRSESADGS